MYAGLDKSKGEVAFGQASRDWPENIYRSTSRFEERGCKHLETAADRCMVIQNGYWHRRGPRGNHVRNRQCWEVVTRQAEWAVNWQTTVVATEFRVKIRQGSLYVGDPEIGRSWWPWNCPECVYSFLWLRQRAVTWRAQGMERNCVNAAD